MGRDNFYDETESFLSLALKHDGRERRRTKERRLADQRPRERRERILQQTVPFARRLVIQVASYREWRAVGASHAAAAVQVRFRQPPGVRKKKVAVVLAILSLPVVGIGLTHVNVKVWLVYLGVLMGLVAATVAPALDSRSTLLRWGGAVATFAALAVVACRTSPLGMGARLTNERG